MNLIVSCAKAKGCISAHRKCETSAYLQQLSTPRGHALGRAHNARGPHRAHTASSFGIRRDACNHEAVGCRQGQAGARGAVLSPGGVERQRRRGSKPPGLARKCHAQGGNSSSTQHCRPCVSANVGRPRKCAGGGAGKREGSRRECVVNWKDRQAVGPPQTRAQEQQRTPAHAPRRRHTRSRPPRPVDFA